MFSDDVFGCKERKVEQIDLKIKEFIGSYNLCLPWSLLRTRMDR